MGYAHFHVNPSGTVAHRWSSAPQPILTALRPKSPSSKLKSNSYGSISAQYSTRSAKPATTTKNHSVEPSAPSPSTGRRIVLTGSTVWALGQIISPQGATKATELATATFASGNPIFLEYVFEQLKYAGVAKVEPGVADGVNAVQVSYQPEKITFVELLRNYWKHCLPTQADGQFEEKGIDNVPIVWTASAEEAKVARQQKDQLEQSEIFGAGAPIVVKIINDTPAFVSSGATGTLSALKKSDPKKFKKLMKVRQKYFDQHFGFVQYCKDNVCGYVRFAPKCKGTCEAVFPEYLETNFGQPELEGNIKFTGGTFK